MSFPRWFVYASFASGLIAFSLNPAGIANVGPTTSTDGSGGNQVGQQGSGSGSTGARGTPAQNPA